MDEKKKQLDILPENTPDVDFTPEVSPRRPVSKLTLGVIILGLCVTVWSEGINPHVIGGHPFPPYSPETQTYSEKISYHFRDPREGEMVIFTSDNGMDFLGLVTGRSGDTYQIVSSTGTPAWVIPKSQITARIYYPAISDSDKNAVTSAASSPIPTISPSPAASVAASPSPVASRKASPKPTVKPSTTPAPTAVSSSATPTPTPSPIQAFAPTPTPRTPSPPQVKITFPVEGQSLAYDHTYTLCIVDAPIGGDTSYVVRAYQLNNDAATQYQNDTICFKPYEGANQILLWYKNSYGEIGGPYTINFTFHWTD